MEEWLKNRWRTITATIFVVLALFGVFGATANNCNINGENERKYTEQVLQPAVNRWLERERETIALTQIVCVPREAGSRAGADVWHCVGRTTLGNYAINMACTTSGCVTIDRR